MGFWRVSDFDAENLTHTARVFATGHQSDEKLITLMGFWRVSNCTNTARALATVNQSGGTTTLPAQQF